MEEYTFFFKGVQEKMKLTRRTCSCLGFSCGCCASMNIQTFNFNRYACMNLTYDPYDFAVTSKMIMNDSEIFTTTFSAKNPPAACLPIIIPYIPIPMEMCTRFFNICTPGRNLHFCMDWEYKIVSQPIIIAHFDCLRVGANGLTLIKVDDDGCQEPSPPPPTGLPGDDVYDEIVEEKH
ncbi:hypothetical protein C0J52_18380 [Blattella germanica]|nr:hypothetical protein C0J52_18380 [Blattella germanica]